MPSVHGRGAQGIRIWMAAVAEKYYFLIKTACYGFVGAEI
jgi:hypothetical protein